MKNVSLFFIAVFSYIISYAQFGPQQVITTDAQLVRSVFAADIDGDGDMDVLSASRIGNNIVWYNNLDGLGDFSELILIDASLSESYSVFSADLDNDGDMDVLATSANLDLVVWYENMDGLGNFGGQQIINPNADGANSAIAADLDGDGDMDVISASDSSGLAWYENTDGNGNFSPEIIITNTLSANRSVFAGDLDGDGDFDIVVNSAGSVTISWFENLDGMGAFGNLQIIAPAALYVSCVFGVDLDGDTDLDILASTNSEDKVAWHENLDGQGNFSAQQIITVLAESSTSVFATDLDNDGDNDVLYTSTPSPIENTSEIGWSENLDGLGNFGPKQVIINTLTFAVDVFATDIDNDGDMDVLSASQNDNTVAWYENLTILGLEDYNESTILIYPNPSKDLIFIEIPNEVITKIEIYNLLGQKIQTFVNNVENINIANLQAGIYLLKIHAENRTITKKIIKM